LPLFKPVVVPRILAVLSLLPHPRWLGLLEKSVLAPFTQQKMQNGPKGENPGSVADLLPTQHASVRLARIVGAAAAGVELADVDIKET
jgi:hypothetical protein